MLITCCSSLVSWVYADFSLVVNRKDSVPGEHWWQGIRCHIVWLGQKYFSSLARPINTANHIEFSMHLVPTIKKRWALLHYSPSLFSLLWCSCSSPLPILQSTMLLRNQRLLLRPGKSLAILRKLKCLYIMNLFVRIAAVSLQVPWLRSWRLISWPFSISDWFHGEMLF